MVLQLAWSIVSDMINNVFISWRWWSDTEEAKLDREQISRGRSWIIIFKKENVSQVVFLAHSVTSISPVTTIGRYGPVSYYYIVTLDHLHDLYKGIPRML